MLDVITWDMYDIVSITIGLVIITVFLAIVTGSWMDNLRAKQAKKKDKHRKEHK